MADGSIFATAHIICLCMSVHSQTLRGGVHAPLVISYCDANADRSNFTIYPMRNLCKILKIAI